MTNIELDVYSLPKVYQYGDGSREYWLRDINGDGSEAPKPDKSPLTSPKDDGTWPEGEVNEIDPQMERVFREIGKCIRGHKVQLHVRYLGSGYPGCFEDPADIQANKIRYFSMDLPNILEVWRAKHARRGKRRIDVIWHLRGAVYDDDKTVLDVVGEKLEVNGFDILHTQRFGHDASDDIFPNALSMKERSLRIDLRRKPHTGLVVQSGTNPYSTEVPPCDERSESDLEAELEAEMLAEADVAFAGIPSYELYDW